MSEYHISVFEYPIVMSEYHISVFEYPIVEFECPIAAFENPFVVFKFPKVYSKKIEIYRSNYIFKEERKYC